MEIIEPDAIAAGGTIRRVIAQETSSSSLVKRLGMSAATSSIDTADNDACKT